MGRLDDAAKRKVVELREAGLSFRKIKAVLELENIKVSAQAIYLFLKEFHGRTRPKDSVPGGSGPSPASGLALAREVGLSEVRQSGWNEQQLRSLLREASRVTSYPSPTDSSGKIGVPQETRGQSSGTGKGGQEQQEGDGKDEDVRIVSVTSLVQNAQHEGINTVRSGISAGAMATAFARRRFTPSPANPVLVARKRLLDKALLHRARVRDSGPQTSPQAVSLLRNQSCFTGADGRKVMLPQAASFEISTTRPPNVRGLHPGASLFRRGLLQRGNLPTRSPQQQQQPRVGIRLPTPTQSSPTPQNPNSSIRAPAPPSQPSPPCQQSGADTAAPSGLQEQVKSLASEIRSLGLALRVIVEQQGRLEREQSQQTQVQKQILSTLQEVASKLGPCSLQHPPASTVPPCPFSSTSQSIYTSCSQAQPRFSEIDGSALENIEQFSLDGLGSASINGFQPCSTSDTLTFTQTHTPSFTQTQAQTYTPDGLSYTQSHTDTFTGLDNKSVEMASTSTDPTFQTSSSSAQASAPPISPHDAQLTIIKVENV